MLIVISGTSEGKRTTLVLETVEEVSASIVWFLPLKF